MGEPLAGDAVYREKAERIAAMTKDVSEVGVRGGGGRGLRPVNGSPFTPSAASSMDRI